MSIKPYEILSSNRHHFGFGIYPEDLFMAPVERTLMRSLPSVGKDSLRSALSNFDYFEKKSHIGKDGFQVSMDVQHFALNEIVVKIVDNFMVIEASQPERQDEHGYISRQFTRRYHLPKGL